MDPTHRITDLTIESSPMPPAFSGTLQEAFDVLVERLRIVSPFKLLRVVVSDVAPTSNQGLWLKFGTQPYVWDETTSTYIPLDINDSLSYSFGTLVDIILANFDPTTKNLLANRINATAQLTDKIITAAKFVDAFGTPKSFVSTNAAGTIAFTAVTPGQTVFADPSTGLPVAGKLPVASLAPGTNGYIAGTVAGVAGWVSPSAFSGSTASALFSIPASQGFLSVDHGFTGVVPSIVRWVLVCIAEDLGYKVDDELSIESCIASDAGPYISAFATHANKTQVRLRVTYNYFQPEAPKIVNQLSGGYSFMNLNSWKLKVYYAR